LPDARQLNTTILHINYANVLHTFLLIGSRHQNAVTDWSRSIDQINHLPNRESSWIFCRIPKHLEKDRLRQLVELGDRRAALGPQRVRVVQDGGDAALFGEGGEQQALTIRIVPIQSWNCSRPIELIETESRKSIGQPPKIRRRGCLINVVSSVDWPARSDRVVDFTE